MAFIQPSDIEAYAKEHTKTPAFFLQSLETTTFTQMDCPQMLCGRIEGQFLKMLVKLTQAKRIVEVGTFTGYSALSMAEGMNADGQIFSCELDPALVSFTRQYFAKTPHAHKITVLEGPAMSSLETLEGPFDMAFIDADKTNYPNYYNLIVPKMRQGGLIVVDNALWSGHVLNPKDAEAKAIAHLNDVIRDDPRVENVFLTVRDGLHLARVL